MQYWWPINVAELAKVQGELTALLRQRDVAVSPGRIVAISAVAHYGSQLPRMAVPEIDLGVEDGDRLWRMAVAVHFPASDAAAAAFDDWTSMLDDLAAPLDDGSLRAAKAGPERLLGNVRTIGSFVAEADGVRSPLPRRHEHVLDDWQNPPTVVGAKHTSAMTRAALEIAKHAAAVANYCDHAEHNETVDQAWLATASRGLCGVATEVAQGCGVDIVESYARRLHAIEAKSGHARALSFDGAAAARAASSWRELQLVQIDHDRAYHPDVFGLTKADQLRHYALHLAKLAGAFARAADGETAEDEILARRLPDTFLFGIKTATAASVRLPDEALGGATWADSTGLAGPRWARSAP